MVPRPTISPAIAGTAYLLAWVVALVVWPSSPSVASSGPQVIAANAGHQAVAVAQSLLAEGVAALALIFVVTAVGHAARKRGARRLARIVVGAGIGAAAVSLLQCALGLLLAGWIAGAGDADRAGFLFNLIDRLDGMKMLVLAVMAAAGAGLATPAGVLAHWLRYVAALQAVALIASGAGYLLLSPALAQAAFVSLPLLLVWVSGAGLALSWNARSVEAT